MPASRFVFCINTYFTLKYEYKLWIENTLISQSKILDGKIWIKTYTSSRLQIIGNTFDMITTISRNYKNKHFIVDKVSPRVSST